MLATVLDHHRTALGALVPLTAVHLAMVAIATAILLPLTAGFLNAVLRWSKRDAVTDQDIARFLITPAGFLGGLVAASLLAVALVLDVAVMMHVIFSGEQSASGAVRTSVAFLIPRLPALLEFAALLILRVLVLGLPFLILAGATAFVLLRRHDINFYLTHRPPAFLAAAGIAGAVLAAMAALLAWKLAGWAAALPLVLSGHPVGPAFAASVALIGDRRAEVLGMLLAWLALRAAMAGAVTLATGGVMGFLAARRRADLRLVAALLLAALVLWMLANAVVSAVSNGALAWLLATEAGVKSLPRPAAASTPVPVWVIAALAAGLLAAGLLAAARLARQVRSRDRVLVIAHRGASALRPENTMAAVLKAIEDGADWIEIDVQETRDGEVVVAHDSDFMKAARNPLKVWDATMADLAGIDIGSHFGAGYAAERPPTLGQVLAACRGRAKVMIELKYYGHDSALESRVAAIVEAAGMTGSVAVMSLKPAGIARFRALRPDWPSGLLAAKAIGDLSRLDVDFLAVNTGQVSLGLVGRAHAAGKEVHVWTVDDPMTMSRMISMGVDGLITNDPALARRIMERRNALSAFERLLLWLVDRFRIGSFRLTAADTEA
ncbi:MAG: glycerophosphodiester phosphodiesterase family protein [Rhodobacteraceae bacterium]|nr:glycerophosphodiester phosphodiesterase family protein [Paracoccaceae bacterium]